VWTEDGIEADFCGVTFVGACNLREVCTAYFVILFENSELHVAPNLQHALRSKKEIFTPVKARKAASYVWRTDGL